VASLAAAEGIDAQDHVHFYIEQDVGAEARRVCEILDDSKAALDVGNAARTHVIAQYSWAQQLAPLDAVMGYQRELAEAAE
jgi:polysaccharide biosynthesis protein PslH